jgi:DNA-binding FadR family transcriptional regulator
MVHDLTLPAARFAGAADLLGPQLEGELEAALATPTRRLPPERELADRLGASRAALRRRLDALEREGRITRHVGRGTFVTAPAATRLDTSPAEIMAVRLLLEPQLPPLAVANATASDIGRMRECLDRGEAAGSFEEFERWDAQLHASIAEATHNQLLVQLFTVMNEARDHPLWGTAKRRSFTAARRHAYECDHRELVDAIDDRHAEAAAQVMRRHLVAIRDALLGTA